MMEIRNAQKYWLQNPGVKHMGDTETGVKSNVITDLR